MDLMNSILSHANVANVNDTIVVTISLNRLNTMKVPQFVLPRRCELELTAMLICGNAQSRIWCWAHRELGWGEGELVWSGFDGTVQSSPRFQQIYRLRVAACDTRIVNDPQIVRHQKPLHENFAWHVSIADFATHE